MDRFVKSHEGKRRQLGKSWCRWQYNTNKMEIKQQGMNMWTVFMWQRNGSMINSCKLRHTSGSKKVENFLTVWMAIRLSRRTTAPLNLCQVRSLCMADDSWQHDYEEWIDRRSKHISWYIQTLFYALIAFLKMLASINKA